MVILPNSWPRTLIALLPLTDPVFSIPIKSNVEFRSNHYLYEYFYLFLLNHLYFSDKPICRPGQKRTYGVARHEDAKVVCEVEAYPQPDNFKWSFNNSAESIDVPQTRYNSGQHRSSSTLTYTPVTELDYGTVMCWANNLAGRQMEPCVFLITAAGKPDPPYNCTILNQTTESLEVECVPGFDGGQPQYFLLEVYDEQTDILQVGSGFFFFWANLYRLLRK